MKNFKSFVLAVMALFTAMPTFAADIDVWTAGKIQAVVNKVEENEAGMVYASATQLTSEDEIAAVEGFFQGEPVLVQGPAYSSETQNTWYFYAKAKPGYKFVGFASSKTGTPSGSNLAEKLDMVGDYYTVSAKSGTPYSAYPETAPKVVTRYAVFEKDETGGGEGGEGGEVSGTIKATGALYGKTQEDGSTSYLNLVGATLVCNQGENFTDGDQVTHIFVQFDKELASIGLSASKELASLVTLVNTTTGVGLSFNQYSCSVWSKDSKALDLMISSDDYINNANHQGVYKFTIPAGAVKSTTGQPNEAYEFTFTYGDPNEAVTPELVNLDDYLGNWKQVKEQGEVLDNPGAFSFEKIGENYYITNLYASTLQIPVTVSNYNYYCGKTQNDQYSFAGAGNNDVEALFGTNSGKKSIYLDQFTLTTPTGSIVGGICYFEKTNGEIPTGISNVEEKNSTVIYDLQGRRIQKLQKGINIVNGKKIVK